MIPVLHAFAIHLHTHPSPSLLFVCFCALGAPIALSTVAHASQSLSIRIRHFSLLLFSPHLHVPCLCFVPGLRGAYFARSDDYGMGRGGTVVGPRHAGQLRPGAIQACGHHGEHKMVFGICEMIPGTFGITC